MGDEDDDPLEPKTMTLWRWLMNKLCPACDSSPAGFFIVGPVREQSGLEVIQPGRERFPFQQGALALAMELTATQKVRVTGQFKDKKGNPALVENGQFITSNGSILGLTNDVHDGTIHTVDVIAIGPIGTASLSLVGDADLGEGIKTVRLDAEVKVVAGQASVGELVFNEPEEQEDQVPPVTPPVEPPPAPPETPPAA